MGQFLERGPEEWGRSPHTDGASITGRGQPEAEMAWQASVARVSKPQTFHSRSFTKGVVVTQWQMTKGERESVWKPTDSLGLKTCHGS